VNQQIQEIAADYSCQLCHPVARNITIQFISFWTWFIVAYSVISYTDHTVYIFQLLQQSTKPPREYFCALLYTCRYTADPGFDILANQLQQAYQQTNKFELDPFL
ncbi:7766_t:CDS:1, partial [Gigaspora margarita]